MGLPLNNSYLSCFLKFRNTNVLVHILYTCLEVENNRLCGGDVSISYLHISYSISGHSYVYDANVYNCTVYLCFF